MKQDGGTGDQAHVTIGGNVSGGQVAAGKNITQVAGAAGVLTPEERLQLDALLADLRARVEAEAPDAQREAALERVGELEEELKSETPDRSTVEYVRNWFVKKLPVLAGAVISVVVNPLVGKLVGVVGEGLAEQVRGRMGG